MRARVAVVGGGIFGSTAAIWLARQGANVTLFEQNPDILSAASGINQYRLHRGYHYPRSFDTVLGCRSSEESFRQEYGPAVLDCFNHYFAVSRRDSLVSADAYLKFLLEAQLEFEVVTPDFLNGDALDLCVRVRESVFDPNILRALVWEGLRSSGVQVRLGHRASAEEVKEYDFVVLATYARMNDLLHELGEPTRQYQFEVCEKIVIKAPEHLKDKSIVIVDGPFTCIDPLGRSGLSVMGHVVHAIHHDNVGLRPIVPDYLQPYLNAGLIRSPPRSHGSLFLEAGREFFRDSDSIQHIGSMFTVRTVLPEMGHTDGRPTLVHRSSPRVVTVFSGKIGTCVAAAKQVVEIIMQGK